CSFEDHIKLWDRYKKIILLDGNEDTIAKLRINHKEFNTYEYIAPDQFPFTMDRSIDYIYCSHLIEHLNPNDLYDLLYEFDRVLKPGGVLVIISPMLSVDFYNTLDHIKPYFPLIFEIYLCGLESGNPSYALISKDYKVEKLVYRYHNYLSDSNRLGSSNKVVDFLIQGIGRISRKLGIRRYRQTGYTMILRKE
ncbi:hypothetical protein LCGC14_2913060, partial [marine sediment metagenome]